LYRAAPVPPEQEAQLLPGTRKIPPYDTEPGSRKHRLAEAYFHVAESLRALAGKSSTMVSMSTSATNAIARIVVAWRNGTRLGLTIACPTSPINLSTYADVHRAAALLDSEGYTSYARKLLLKGSPNTDVLYEVQRNTPRFNEVVVPRAELLNSYVCFIPFEKISKTLWSMGEKSNATWMTSTQVEKDKQEKEVKAEILNIAMSVCAATMANADCRKNQTRIVSVRRRP
jgi:hypothetical protein